MKKKLILYNHAIQLNYDIMSNLKGNLRKKKKEISKISTVTKIDYYFMSINPTLLKIYMQVFSDSLNNFT
jgi:hypothetical protein